MKSLFTLILFTSILTGCSLRHKKQVLTANPVFESDKFAWELFAYVNQPTSKKTNEVLWQTWAKSDFVFADPRTAPKWSERNRSGFKLAPIQQVMMLDRELGQKESSALNKKFVDNGAGQEVRMNKDTFDFIVANNLWFLEGQEAHFNDMKKLAFPSSSIEIKAVWQHQEPCDQKEFHCKFDSAGKSFALIALHITSRALPNWFWATFEHRKNKNHCAPKCVDSFGAVPQEGRDPKPSAALLTLLKNAGLGPEWKNYLLEGSQIDFIDSTGKKLTLGNPFIELGFTERSSCITCHSRMTVDDKGNRLPLTENGGIPLGCPDPGWFYDNPGGSAEKRKYFQLDFVWSLCQAKSLAGNTSGCPPSPN